MRETIIFGLGWGEIIIIFLVVLLISGASKVKPAGEALAAWAEKRSR